MLKQIFLLFFVSLFVRSHSYTIPRVKIPLTERTAKEFVANLIYGQNNYYQNSDVDYNTVFGQLFNSNSKFVVEETYFPITAFEQYTKRGRSMMKNFIRTGTYKSCDTRTVEFTSTVSLEAFSYQQDVMQLTETYTFNDDGTVMQFVTCSGSGSLGKFAKTIGQVGDFLSSAGNVFHRVTSTLDEDLEEDSVTGVPSIDFVKKYLENKHKRKFFDLNNKNYSWFMHFYTDPVSVMIGFFLGVMFLGTLICAVLISIGIFKCMGLKLFIIGNGHGQNTQEKQQEITKILENEFYAKVKNLDLDSSEAMNKQANADENENVDEDDEEEQAI